MATILQLERENERMKTALTKIYRRSFKKGHFPKRIAQNIAAEGLGEIKDQIELEGLDEQAGKTDI